MGDNRKDNLVDKNAVNMMMIRILKKEMENEKTNLKTDAEMVKIIRKIIEEEAEAHVN
ncbi:MAG: hypothetical protein K6B68_15585 [Eubacterium sp.]|nr:hypothetical protein [Eubacterium sp.]